MFVLLFRKARTRWRLNRSASGEWVDLTTIAALSNYESSLWVWVNGRLIGYCSFAYSALACFRMGMSGSASFHSVRKSL